MINLKEKADKTVHDRIAEVAYQDFHELWGKAKESDNYNKREWTRLYISLCQLIEHKPFNF